MIRYYKVNVIYNSKKGFTKSDETYKLYADPFTGDKPVFKENEDGTYVIYSESKDGKNRRVVSTLPASTIEHAIKAWNYRKGNGFFFPKLREMVDDLIKNNSSLTEKERNEYKDKIFKMAIKVARGKKALEKLGLKDDVEADYVEEEEN